MSLSRLLGFGLACVVLVGCTPKQGGRWCDQENEVSLLAQTPSGIPMLRVRELQGPFAVELQWSATRHAFAVNGGVHQTEAVFDGERTVATFSVQPRAGRAVFAQSVDHGECGDDVLLVPVSLRLRTDDGRIDATFDAEAEFRDGERSVLGKLPGLPVQGLELPHCAPRATAAGLSFDAEAEAAKMRPYLTVICRVEPQTEALAPGEHQRLRIPDERYVLGTWNRL